MHSTAGDAAPVRQPRRGLPWRWIALGMLVGVVLVTFAELIVVPTYWISHRSPLPGEAPIGRSMVSLSARLHGSNATNPYPKDAASTAQGQVVFRECAGCHGNLGDGKGFLSTGLYPVASNLLGEQTAAKSDGELFWLINHGLSFTAMPGYSDIMSDDDDLWAVVNYLRALQEGRALVFTSPSGEPTGGVTDNRSIQAFALAISDDGVQPPALSASAGIVQLGLANRGSKLHQVVISEEGKVPYDAGSLFPTQTVGIQAELKSGVYTIAVDPKAPTPGPIATLTVK